MEKKFSFTKLVELKLKSGENCWFPHQTRRSSIGNGGGRALLMVRWGKSSAMKNQTIKIVNKRSFHNIQRRREEKMAFLWMFFMPLSNIGKEEKNDNIICFIIWYWYVWVFLLLPPPRLSLLFAFRLAYTNKGSWENGKRQHHLFHLRLLHEDYSQLALAVPTDLHTCLVFCCSLQKQLRRFRWCFHYAYDFAFFFPVRIARKQKEIKIMS